MNFKSQCSIQEKFKDFFRDLFTDFKVKKVMNKNAAHACRLHSLRLNEKLH